MLAVIHVSSSFQDPGRRSSLSWDMLFSWKKKKSKKMSKTTRQLSEVLLGLVYITATFNSLAKVSHMARPKN